MHEFIRGESGKIERFRGEYFFLSNFYPAEVMLDGETYPTVEHAYQAAKSLRPATRQTIRQAPKPGKAKALGSGIHERSDWKMISIDIMRGLLVQKFAHPELRDMLIATGERELVEGNTWNDTFWGVCNGVGQNMLGKLLMEIRETLKAQDNA